MSCASHTFLFLEIFLFVVITPLYCRTLFRMIFFFSARNRFFLMQFTCLIFWSLICILLHRWSNSKLQVIVGTVCVLIIFILFIVLVGICHSDLCVLCFSLRWHLVWELTNRTVSICCFPGFLVLTLVTASYEQIELTPSTMGLSFKFYF